MKDKKMTAAERFAAMGERLRADGRLQVDEAKLELSEQIFELMEDKGITEAELARRLGTSRAYVNKVLQGSTNFTIESLVKIGLALDCELKLEFAKSKSDVLDADIIYEEPIDEPKIISKPSLNVFNFADFKVKQTVKDFTNKTKFNPSVENDYATIQDAA